ncbi:PREDICTED: K(+) efflux antiporter 3, chloroplastic isoform X1 [Theobroma cacao]|uniref:K(+) efflux antiporter 3, chloroplastic isoform X1 n=1 Tax=Theobroma cacao TaxID=3641 RepID=A0AB32VUA4_THECC|nr:PREDICTED: K(+) efflux antiporter 3, chloroplastic isoform X1 [Theobroma cacao]
MLESISCCHSPKGYDFVKRKSLGSAYRQAVSWFSGHSSNMSYINNMLFHSRPILVKVRTNNCTLVLKHIFGDTPLQSSSPSNWRGLEFSDDRLIHRGRSRIYAAVDVASAVDVINDLGLDTLTFLAVTVMVVPAFKIIRASPILGFFFAGVVLNQFALIRNLTDVKVLSEWGILFLLFEMGLELSLARLKALAKFAFGMGLTQVVLSTLAFTAFELPPNGAIGTRILEFLFHSRPDLVNIRSIDEAVVIGAALSLSSSAFVLQLLAEKGELPTRFGSATLGILLLQDIAVVPLLVILPVLESQNLVEESIWPMLAQESLKALGGLGLLSLGGKYILRRVFEVVAETRSSEAFVALCVLTVAGTSLLTQQLGFSDTLGAFLAGALLAETNFRTQIEADIRPFRGLLLGLFFMTTGTSIDMQLLYREWPNVLTLLAGLIVIKTLIITAIGPRVGLTLQESVRVGFLLSQGGEFAFVVFSLANRLGVLPLELNKLLIIVVVLSMALTPWLNEVGRRAADFIDDKFDADKFLQKAAETVNFDASEPIVIIGFGQMGQVLANFLSTPLASGVDGDSMGLHYVGFDLNPSVVKASRKLGFPILYGDGSRPAVLQSAGISSPKAVMIMYRGKKRTIEAVQRLRLAFPAVPIYARAQDLKHLLDLKKAGATDAILENTETSLQFGSKLLKGFGVMSDDVTFLSELVRDSMELQAQEELSKTDDREFDIMKPLQARVAQVQASISSTSSEDNLSRESQIDRAQVSRLQGGVDPTDKLSTSSEDELSRKNLADRTQVLQLQDEVNQGKHDSVLHQSEDELSRKNLADRTQVSQLQEEVDQGKHDSELHQSENPKSQGVLYCELDTENGFPIKTADSVEERNTLTTTEEC